MLISVGGTRSGTLMIERAPLIQLLRGGLEDVARRVRAGQVASRNEPSYSTSAVAALSPPHDVERMTERVEQRADVERRRRLRDGAE